MSGQFLKRGEIADLARNLGITNSIRKRQGLTQHPTRAVICGCPDENCGGWHVIDTSRVIPSDEEADFTLRLDSKRRKLIRRGHSGTIYS